MFRDHPVPYAGASIPTPSPGSNSIVVRTGEQAAGDPRGSPDPSGAHIETAFIERKEGPCYALAIVDQSAKASRGANERSDEIRTERLRQGMMDWRHQETDLPTARYGCRNNSIVLQRSRGGARLSGFDADLLRYKQVNAISNFLCRTEAHPNTRANRLGIES
jgi:hypothetical protein